MMHLVGISGSLRRHSYNSGLLHAAAAVLPQGVTLDILSIAGIPLYDGDVEDADGLPAAMDALKEAIAHADGLLIATPEYNSGLPGVLKNALDWASRPPADKARVFGGKPVAVIGATPGMGGTIMAQAHALPVMRALGAVLFTGRQLHVSGAGKLFDAEGRLTDDAMRERLRAFVTDFVAAIG